MRGFLWVLPMLPSLALGVALVYTLVLGGRQANDGRVRPNHRKWANWTIALTAVSVASMSAGDYLGLMPKANPTLLAVHLLCILAYAALAVIMRFGITGARHRLVHIALGCLMIPVVFIAALTGVVLTSQAIAASL